MGGFGLHDLLPSHWPVRCILPITMDNPPLPSVSFIKKYSFLTE